MGLPSARRQSHARQPSDFKCMEVTRKYRMHFNEYFPEKWKWGPRMLKNDDKFNWCKALTQVYRTIYNKMEINIRLLKTATAYFVKVVCVWMPSHKADRSSVVMVFVRAKCRLVSIWCPNDIRHLYTIQLHSGVCVIYPMTQTGYKYLWWSKHAHNIWHFHYQRTPKISIYNVV